MYDSLAKMTAMGSKMKMKAKKDKSDKKDDKDWTNAPSSLEFGKMLSDENRRRSYDTRMMTNSERKAQAGPIEAKKDKAMARRNAVARARAKAAKKKPPVFNTKNIPVSPTK